MNSVIFFKKKTSQSTCFEFIFPLMEDKSHLFPGNYLQSGWMDGDAYIYASKRAIIGISSSYGSAHSRHTKGALHSLGICSLLQLLFL